MAAEVGCPRPIDEEVPALLPEWKRVVRVFWRRKLAVVGLAVLVLMILVAVVRSVDRAP